MQSELKIDTLEDRRFELGGQDCSESCVHKLEPLFLLFPFHFFPEVSIAFMVPSQIQKPVISFFKVPVITPHSGKAHGEMRSI